MNEPTRLLSTPESELERALLEAGRSYTASGSTRAKTLLALGLTGVAPSVAPAAHVAGKTLTKASLAKVAISVLVVGAVALPVWRYLGQHAGSTTVAQPAVAAATVPVPTASPAEVPPAPAEAAPAEAAPIASTTPDSVREASEPPASSNARGGRAVRSELKPSSAPPLTAELAALDAARTSLSHADPAGALAALDGYARDFPRGRLKLEAEVLRIGALAKSGQTDAARKRAEAFLRHHPDSVLASRVRSYADL